MVSAQRRAKAKENLRRAIMDAARELFATEDYKAVSMRRLAEKIEYSPTAIYLHFKDKEEILYHLIEEGFAMLAERLEAIAIADPIERLRQGARVYFEFAFAQPHYYRLMFQLQDKELAASLMPKIIGGPRSFQFIVAAVQQAFAEGRFRREGDLEAQQAVVAHVIWSHIHGAVALTLSGHLCMKLPEELQDRFYSVTVETTLRGLAV